MATENPSRRPHLFPQNTRTTEGYTAPSGGGGARPAVPPLLREQHAADLRAQLAQVAAAQQQRVAERRATNLQTALGVQVEFESQQGVKLAAESLARDRQGIELMNVRQRDGQILATVFVPQGKLPHFEKLIAAYVGRRTDSAGRSRDNQSLIDAIRAVRVATFDSLWTDTAEALPVDEAEPIWWEAWLAAGEHRAQILADFRRVAAMAGLVVRERVLSFPERSVAQMHGTKAQLLQSSLVLNMVAELRRSKTTAEFFAALRLEEQAGWADALHRRLAPEHRGNSYVTLLDTGVNNEHPLLAPMVDAADRHSINPAWGPDDQNGHGTELAGLALLGDLTPSLSDDGVLSVPHRLESVKILRGPGDNDGESYGAITAEAVARVEVTDPHRLRTFTMAVSSADGRDRGRPSSWSAEIDRLACDYEGRGETPRLFLLCAGNTRDQDAWTAYPESLSTNSVHDPGQAWNALTVGACSELTTISETDAQQFAAIAPVGGLHDDVCYLAARLAVQAGHRDGRRQCCNRCAGRLRLFDGQPVPSHHRAPAARPPVHPELGDQRGNRACGWHGGADTGRLPELLAGDRARADGPLGAMDTINAGQLRTERREQPARAAATAASLRLRRPQPGPGTLQRRELAHFDRAGPIAAVPQGRIRCAYLRHAPPRAALADRNFAGTG
jgi:hypothetical protein